MFYLNMDARLFYTLQIPLLVVINQSFTWNFKLTNNNCDDQAETIKTCSKFGIKMNQENMTSFLRGPQLCHLLSLLFVLDIIVKIPILVWQEQSSSVFLNEHFHWLNKM